MSGVARFAAGRNSVRSQSVGHSAAALPVILLVSCAGTTVFARAQVPATLLPSAETARRSGGDTPQPSTDSATAGLAAEKLALEVEKLRIENANAERSLVRPRGWVNLLYGNVSVIVALILGFFGLLRYLRERAEGRRNREDERFEALIKSLGSNHEQERVGAAVLLPTFLHAGYERFYVQVFNLAAGNLRAKSSAEEPDDDERSLLIRRKRPAAPRAAPGPPDPLVQALATVLRESYPRARAILYEVEKNQLRRSQREDLFMAGHLNGSGICLAQTYLAGADLKNAWLRGSSFRAAQLPGARIDEAVLEQSDLSLANLSQATLSRANLREANLTRADLEAATLSGANADGANFKDANLKGLVMDEGSMRGADFSGARLDETTFRDVDFGPQSTDGRRGNPEHALTLTDAVFENVTGLDAQARDRCERAGARFVSREGAAKLATVRI